MMTLVSGAKLLGSVSENTRFVIQACNATNVFFLVICGGTALKNLYSLYDNSKTIFKNGQKLSGHFDVIKIFTAKKKARKCRSRSIRLKRKISSDMGPEALRSIDGKLRAAYDKSNEQKRCRVILSAATEEAISRASPHLGPQDFQRTMLLDKLLRFYDRKNDRAGFEILADALHQEAMQTGSRLNDEIKRKFRHDKRDIAKRLRIYDNNFRKGRIDEEFTKELLMLSIQNGHELSKSISEILSSDVCIKHALIASGIRAYEKNRQHEVRVTDSQKGDIYAYLLQKEGAARHSFEQKYQIAKTASAASSLAVNVLLRFTAVTPYAIVPAGAVSVVLGIGQWYYKQKEPHTPLFDARSKLRL